MPILGFRRSMTHATLVAALAFGLTLAPTISSAQQRAAKVEVDVVISQELTATVSVIGRFITRQSGTIASRIAERVDTVSVEVGDRIERGDVLASLSSDRLDAERDRWAAQVRSARAQVERERANLAKAQQGLDRQNRLQGSTAFRKDRAEDAERDVDIARAALATAEADAAQARAQLSTAEIALSDATIRAPYDGVVTVKHVSAGAYVRLGDPIVTLLNDVELEIEADVPAQRTGGLRIGTMVEVDLASGERLVTAVRAVVPEENPRTRTRAVRFVPQFDGRAAGIAINESVSLQIPLARSRTVLTVHKDAVTVQGGRQVVFIVVEGKATPRTVETGESVGKRFEVNSGLSEGDQTVIRGNERLRPGQPVAAGG